jgi:hypothetical protein
MVSICKRFANVRGITGSDAASSRAWTRPRSSRSTEPRNIHPDHAVRVGGLFILRDGSTCTGLTRSSRSCSEHGTTRIREELIAAAAEYVEYHGPAVWNHSRWDSSVFADGCAEDRIVPLQRRLHLRRVLLLQPSRPFDVGAQERHRSRRPPVHAPSLASTLRSCARRPRPRVASHARAYENPAARRAQTPDAPEGRACADDGSPGLSAPRTPKAEWGSAYRRFGAG